MLVDWVEDGKLLSLSVQRVDRRVTQAEDVLHVSEADRGKLGS